MFRTQVFGLRILSRTVSVNGEYDKFILGERRKRLIQVKFKLQDYG